MELPEEVLQIIKEYSMPLTRPDWRTLHKMPQHVYKDECFYQAIRKWNSIGETNRIFTLWWYINMYPSTFYEN